MEFHDPGQWISIFRVSILVGKVGRSMTKPQRILKEKNITSIQKKKIIEFPQATNDILKCKIITTCIHVFKL